MWWERLHRHTHGTLYSIYILRQQQHDVHKWLWHIPYLQQSQIPSLHCPTGTLTRGNPTCIVGMGMVKDCPSSTPPFGTVTDVVVPSISTSKVYPSERVAGATTSIIGYKYTEKGMNRVRGPRLNTRKNRVHTQNPPSERRLQRWFHSKCSKSSVQLPSFSTFSCCTVVEISE